MYFIDIDSHVHGLKELFDVEKLDKDIKYVRTNVSEEMEQRLKEATAFHDKAMERRQWIVDNVTAHQGIFLERREKSDWTHDSRGRFVQKSHVVYEVEMYPYYHFPQGGKAGYFREQHVTNRQEFTGPSAHREVLKFAIEEMKTSAYHELTGDIELLLKLKEVLLKSKEPEDAKVRELVDHSIEEQLRKMPWLRERLIANGKIEG